MPDVVLGVAGTTNSERLSGSCNPTNSSDKLDVNHSKNTNQPILMKGTQALAAVGSQALPIVVKKDLVVNGTEEEPLVLNAKATIVETSQAKLPAVNG
jgi:hypothetical protein